MLTPVLLKLSYAPPQPPPPLIRVIENSHAPPSSLQSSLSLPLPSLVKAQTSGPHTPQVFIPQVTSEPMSFSWITRVPRHLSRGRSRKTWIQREMNVDNKKHKLLYKCFDFYHHFNSSHLSLHPSLYILCIAWIEKTQYERWQASKRIISLYAYNAGINAMV